MVEEPQTPWAEMLATLTTIAAHLAVIKQAAEATAAKPPRHDRYTTEEVAKIFGRRPRTPQKWCRERQVHCVRIARDGTYRITHEEVERIRNHWLLPPGAGQVVEE